MSSASTAALLRGHGLLTRLQSDIHGLIWQSGIYMAETFERFPSLRFLLKFGSGCCLAPWDHGPFDLKGQIRRGSLNRISHFMGQWRVEQQAAHAASSARKAAAQLLSCQARPHAGPQVWGVAPSPPPARPRSKTPKDDGEARRRSRLSASATRITSSEDHPILERMVD